MPVIDEFSAVMTAGYNENDFITVPRGGTEIFPNNVRTGSQLLGVSPPTFRRRAQELSTGA